MDVSVAASLRLTEGLQQLRSAAAAQHAGASIDQCNHLFCAVDSPCRFDGTASTAELLELLDLLGTGGRPEAIAGLNAGGTGIDGGLTCCGFVSHHVDDVCRRSNKSDTRLGTISSKFRVFGQETIPWMNCCRT